MAIHMTPPRNTTHSATKSACYSPPFYPPSTGAMGAMGAMEAIESVDSPTSHGIENGIEGGLLSSIWTLLHDAEEIATNRDSKKETKKMYSASSNSSNVGGYGDCDDDKEEEPETLAHTVLAVVETLSGHSNVKNIYGRVRKVLDQVAICKKEFEKSVEPGFLAPHIRPLVCPVCNNKNHADFIFKKNGEIVCKGSSGRGCGEIVEIDRVYDGLMYRVFTEEENRNSVGAAWNPMMSQAYNLGTRTTAPTRRRRTQKSATSATSHKETAFAVSGIGKDPGATRIEYKDEHKMAEFRRVMELETKLGLHSAVIAKSKYMFTICRDSDERMRDTSGTLAACVIVAIVEVRGEEKINGRVIEFNCQGCGQSFGTLRDRQHHYDTTLHNKTKMNRKTDNRKAGNDSEQDHIQGRQDITEKHILGNQLPNEPYILAFKEEKVREYLKRVLEEAAAPNFKHDNPGMWKTNIDKNVGRIVEGLRKDVKADGLMGKVLLITSKEAIARFCGGNTVVAEIITQDVARFKERQSRKHRREKEDNDKRIKERRSIDYERTRLGRHPL